MDCPLCGAHDAREIPGPYQYAQSGLDWVRLEGVEHVECQHCHEVTVTIPNESRLLELIAKTIIEADRPLGSKEIRFLRGLIGWTQDKLGASVGKQRLAVARWESDPKHRPGPQTDLILRLVWLKAYLEQEREEGCGFLDDALLQRMTERIQQIGGAIKRIRTAPALSHVSINARTCEVVTVECG